MQQSYAMQQMQHYDLTDKDLSLNWMPAVHDFANYLRRRLDAEIAHRIEVFRECGVTLERFSIETERATARTYLCVDNIRRFCWTIKHGH